MIIMIFAFVRINPFRLQINIINKIDLFCCCSTSDYPTPYISNDSSSGKGDGGRRHWHVRVSYTFWLCISNNWHEQTIYICICDLIISFHPVLCAYRCEMRAGVTRGAWMCPWQFNHMRIITIRTRRFTPTSLSSKSTTKKEYKNKSKSDEMRECCVCCMKRTLFQCKCALCWSVVFCSV